MDTPANTPPNDQVSGSNGAGASGSTPDTSPTRLREQLKQLDALRASGALDEAQHAQSRQRLLDRLAALGEAATPARAGRALWGLTATVVLGLAVAGYAVTGRPDAVFDSRGLAAGAEPAQGAASAPTPEQVNEMVARLAERLKDRPDDVQGWTMLARSYMALGRAEEAAQAYRKLLAQRPEDPNVLADLADALAVSGGRTLDGEPARLIERALKIDPEHPKALALAGAHAFDKGDYATAARHWERVAQLAPPDSPMAQQAREGAEEARRLARPGGGAAAPGTGAAATAATQPGSDTGSTASGGSSSAAAPAASVSGTVSLAASLRGRASPEDTVFIFARAADGPRMPLALMRRQVKDLPLSFKLDDAMAMAPGATLSSVRQVVVGARISKSGQAMPQAGDLEGLSAPVAVGAKDLRIEIDRVVP